MSRYLHDAVFFSVPARAAYFVVALLTVAVGHIWVYWHAIETVMDLAAPAMFLFLAFAQRRDDAFVKLSLASFVVLVVAMLAAAKWMTIPA